MQDGQSAYVTPEDAAIYFDTTPEKMRRLCRDGKIPGARKLGREWRIPRSFLTTDIDTVQKMADEEEKK
jgi:excisionase family DNA binding protein